jgi:hypothetical protein
MHKMIKWASVTFLVCALVVGFVLMSLKLNGKSRRTMELNPDRLRVMLNPPNLSGREQRLAEDFNDAINRIAIIRPESVPDTWRRGYSHTTSNYPVVVGKKLSYPNPPNLAVYTATVEQAYSPANIRVAPPRPYPWQRVINLQYNNGHFNVINWHWLRKNGKIVSN